MCNCKVDGGRASFHITHQTVQHQQYDSFVSCCCAGKSQKQRLAALHVFKSELVPLLLATDVASRGLDIPTVDLVVNYDLPRLAADYVHR
jgi:ATP-dependent RNA helicase DDX49/DBP8